MDTHLCGGEGGRGELNSQLCDMSAGFAGDPLLCSSQLPAMSCHLLSAAVSSALELLGIGAGWGGGARSPQPVLFVLAQLHVSLHHPQDVLRLVVRQGRQVQPPAHCSRPRHAELLLLLLLVRVGEHGGGGVEEGHGHC